MRGAVSSNLPARAEIAEERPPQRARVGSVPGPGVVEKSELIPEVGGRESVLGRLEDCDRVMKVSLICMKRLFCHT